MKRDFKLYRTLFSSTFFLSAFTFGGGFVIVPLMKKKFSDELHWIEEKEILDLTAIAQSSPGPIAVNAAALIGHRLGGLPGALISILAAILPPLIIISVIASAYAAFRDNAIVGACLKGMQSGVAAVILDVVLSMGEKIVKTGSVLRMLIMAGAFIAVFFFEVNVILIIAAAALIGVITVLMNARREVER